MSFRILEIVPMKLLEVLCDLLLANKSRGSSKLDEVRCFLAL